MSDLKTKFKKLQAERDRFLKVILDLSGYSESPYQVEFYDVIPAEILGTADTLSCICCGAEYMKGHHEECPVDQFEKLVNEFCPQVDPEEAELPY